MGKNVPKSGNTETAWLIENTSVSPPSYLCINPVAKIGEWPFVFTIEHMAALRLGRKVDADSLRKIVAPGVHIKSVQHGWAD